MEKILILIAFISNPVFADNYVSEGGSTSYAKKRVCEQMDSKPCYLKPDKDTENTHVFKDVEVDDYAKPIYLKRETTSDLVDLDACYAEIAPGPREVDPVDCELIRDTGSGKEGSTVCEVSMLTYCHLYGGANAICMDQGDGSFEAYCAVPNGYEPKTERQLVEDAKKKEDYEEALAQKLLDADTRKTQLDTVKQRLKSLDVDAATDLPGLKAIVKDLWELQKDSL